MLDLFHYDDYVEYLATLVDFIVREQQAPVWAITIANEPDGGDGNHIPPDGLAYIARQLAMRLAPYGVKLYGPDTASAAHALEYLPGLLEDPVIADALAFVGFHQYRADPGVAVVGDYVRARRPELPVIVTEYTSFSYGALDDGQEASDELGFMLEILDTVLAHYRSGADAALYWDAVDYLQPGHDAITRWGLLRGPAEAFAPRKWYYGMSQVLPYLRPGTRLLTTSQVGGEELAVTAMRTPEDGLAIVLLNIGAGPIDLVLNLAGEGATPVNDLSVHRTDDDEDAAFVGRVSTSDDGVLVTLPGYSVTTLSTPGYTPSWLHVE